MERKHFRRILTAVGAVLLIVALLATSCGPAAAPTATPRPPTATPAAKATPVPPTPTPEPGVRTMPEPGRVYKVGYTQIVDHPSLNKNRDGLLAALEEAGFVEGRNLIFDYQNAQGDLTNARNIAEKFLADGVDLIAACTTPNSQAAVQVAKGTDTPVLFGCVTDPVAAGIVPSVDKPSGTNVTGQWGPAPIPELFDLYAEIKPDMAKVGTIYNPSETNSVVMVRQSKEIAAAKGYEWIEATVSSSADVKTAAESLIGRVDTIVIVQDNTTASALEAVIKVAQDNDIALFPMDPDSVERGAIASLATDPFNDGKLFGGLVIRVLLGEDPGTITPIKPTVFDLYVNVKAAKEMGVTIPQSVLDRAFKIYD